MKNKKNAFGCFQISVIASLVVILIVILVLLLSLMAYLFLPSSQTAQNITAQPLNTSIAATQLAMQATDQMSTAMAQQTQIALQTTPPPSPTLIASNTPFSIVIIAPPYNPIPFTPDTSFLTLGAVSAVPYTTTPPVPPPPPPLTDTPDSFLLISATATPITVVIVPTTQSSTPTQTLIADLTQAAQIAWKNFQDFEQVIKANIVFNSPPTMQIDTTTRIELILNPSIAINTLAPQLIGNLGLQTSTAQPQVLVAPNGQPMSIQSAVVEITPYMQAELKSQDPVAFTITPDFKDPIQHIDLAKSTTWSWSVKAETEGNQILVLVLSSQVIDNGKESWHMLEPFTKNIYVNVSPLIKVKSLDWKWIAGFMLALVGSVLGILNFLNNRKKKTEEEKPVQSPKKKKK
jgi:hypothetical protein